MSECANCGVPDSVPSRAKPEVVGSKKPTERGFWTRWHWYKDSGMWDIGATFFVKNPDEYGDYDGGYNIRFTRATPPPPPVERDAKNQRAEDLKQWVNFWATGWSLNSEQAQAIVEFLGGKEKASPVERDSDAELLRRISEVCLRGDVPQVKDCYALRRIADRIDREKGANNV